MYPGEVLGVAGPTPGNTGLGLVGSGRVITNEGLDQPYTPGRFSVEVWVRPEEFSAGELFSNHSGAQSFWLTPWGQVVGRVFMYDPVPNGDWAEYPVFTTVPLNLGEWNHVVLTSVSGALLFYVNGVLVGLTPTPPDWVTSYGGGGGIAFGEGVVGSIDEVAIYDTALSANAVAGHYVASGRVLDGPILDSESFGTNQALRDCGCIQDTAGDPVDTRTGNLHMPLPGLVVPGRGAGLSFAPAYNSLGTDEEGVLGYGWSSILDVRLEAESDGSRTVVQEGGATVPIRPEGTGWRVPGRFSATLEDNGDGTVTFVRNQFERFVFDDTTGRLVAIEDQFANRTTISYDSGGSASFMEDEAGRRLTFAWDGDRLVSVTDPEDRTVTFVYDGSGNLASYTDPDDGVWTFGWTSGTRFMETMRKPRHTNPAFVVEMGYDTGGRVLWQDDELNRRTSFAQDTPVAGSTTVTFPSGRQRVDTYVAEVFTSQTEAANTTSAATTTFERDPITLVLTGVGDPEGNVTSYTVDERGNRLTTTDPTGRVVARTFNELDQVTSETSGSPATTSRWDYDSDGRLLGAVVAAGTADEATTAYEYDAAHPDDLVSIIDGRGQEWEFVYDADTGDLTDSFDPLGNRTHLGYNEIGWVASQVSPRGYAAGATAGQFTTTFTHDGFGRVLSTAGPEGTASSRVYDPNGNLTTMREGAGTPDELVTTYQYDASDRLVVMDPPGAGQRSYTTWPDGQQASFTNEAGAVWQYGVDDLGRLVTAADPLSNTTTFGYDAAGRLETLTDPTGQVATYAYDDAGRPASVDYSDPGTPDLTAIGYDAAGRRISATVGGTAETWGWDRAGRLASHVDVNGRTTTYGWDDTGNLTAIGYPGAGTLTRRFDAAGRLDRVTDWAGRVTDFGYDENSNWRQTTFPTASTNTDLYGYDRADRLTSISWRRGATVLGSLTYGARDGLGNVTAVTGAGAGAGGSTTWGYDERNRLETAGAESFGVDPAGNLVEGPDGNLGVFDPAQRLCWTSPTATGGGCSTPAADATTYDYDDAGRRTAMTLPSGTTASYGYDGAGRLASATVPTTTEAADRQYQTLAAAVVANTATGVGSCDGATCSTLVAADPVEVRVGGVGGVPATGVVAVTGTITVTGATGDGFVEINPTGSSAAAGVIAAEAGATSSGGFTAALGAQGDLVLEANVGADVVLEVSGYFTPPPVWVPARNYWPTTPTTIGSGSVAAGTTNVTVGGVGGVPATGVAAVTVTVLATGTGAGTLRFAPNGAASAGTVAWDAAFPLGSGSYTVPVNANGTITVAASGATTLLGFSVTGYWSVPSGGDVGLGLELLASGPARVLDTTTGTGTCVPSPCDTVINAAAPTQVTVAGIAGVPADADAVLVSVSATGAGYGIGAVSSSEAGGNVGMLAFDAGTVASASVIVPVDDDGTIDLASLYTNAEFTIDVIGHFAQPSATITYAYGADGLRTRAQGGAGVGDRQYTWSAAGGLPLLLAEHRGTATSYLVYGPGGAPLYQITAAGQPVYLHLDHLGSVRHTTAANGTNRGSLTYSPYGKVETNTTNWAAEQPLLGYAGEYTDPGTGFIYLRARHYDPATGQFLTRDPLEAVTRDPYGYAGANPSNWTDPTGLFPRVRLPSPRDLVEGAVDAVSDTVSSGIETVREAAQDTGEFIVRNRGTIATGLAVGGCVAFTLGVCAAATAAAFVVRSEQAVREHPDGWEGARRGILIDGAITAATFGLVSYPAWAASIGTGRHFTLVDRGLLWGAPAWQAWFLRIGTSTPDLAGLVNLECE